MEMEIYRVGVVDSVTDTVWGNLEMIPTLLSPKRSLPVAVQTITPGHTAHCPACGRIVLGIV